MPDSELIPKAIATYEAFLTLGNERFEGSGATFVRNRTIPNRYDANHVALVRARTADEVRALSQRVDAEFVSYSHRAFYLDPLTPPQIEAEIALRGGYRRSEELVLVLEGELIGKPRQADIRLVQDESQWQALFRLNRLWTAMYPPERSAPDEQTEASMRSKAPDVRWWLAYVEGEPRAFFTSWEGVDGVGQVENLFTQAEFRHLGLATALIHHCVADARAHGAGPVIISADPDDTPKLMYASMGWRPLMVLPHFVRTEL